MKRGEVQRHIGPEFAHDPGAHRRNLLDGIVFARYQERCDLEPDVGFVLEIYERVQHRLQARAAQPEIELVGERLEIDVRGIHLCVERPPRRVVHIARGDGDRFYALRAARIGDIHRIFGKNYRIVIGEGDALAAAGERGLSNGCRRGLVGEPVHVLGFADVPVLAELAREIAAGGAEGEHARTGVKMIERFLLDRIDAKTRRAAVCRQYHPVADALAHEARAALAFMQAAVARAQVALHAPVVEHVPPAAGVAHAFSPSPLRAICLPYNATV